MFVSDVHNLELSDSTEEEKKEMKANGCNLMIANNMFALFITKYVYTILSTFLTVQKLNSVAGLVTTVIALEGPAFSLIGVHC